MNIKNSLTLFFFLAFLQLSMAQAPGYLGKRVSLEYNTGRAILDLPFTFKQFGNGLGHDIRLNYVTSKNGQISLNYSLQSTNKFTHVDDEVNTYYIHFDRNRFKEQNVKSSTVSVQYRKYKNGIAPIGRYTQIILGYSLNQYTLSNGINDNQETAVDDIVKKFNSPIFGVGYGKAILIGDGLYLNYGVDFIYTLKDYKDNSEFPSSGLLFLSNILRFRIGLGYPIF